MSAPLAANTVDAAALADELARFRVLDPTRLTELLSEFSGGGSVALAEFLVRRGALTPYQADRALAGQSRALALGPYRLNGLAGSGTFGPVYSATHKDRPGEFRLHVFPLRSLWRTRQAKQLARTLAAVPRPAITALLDADSANGLHYLVWPHAEGEPLTDRVATAGPLLPGEVAGLLAHLADALHACHLRKVIHGTITPKSVVLGSDGLPRLLELGAGAILAANLADEESLLDTLSAAIAAAGVMEYAAPEFILDPTTAAPAADQFALGAVGYFALTGQSPFPVGSLVDGLVAKLVGPPRLLDQLNSSIPEDLAAIIDRMLCPAPGDRFSGLDEVQECLAAVAGLPESVRGTMLAASSPSPECLPLSALSDPSRSSGHVSFSSPGPGLTELPMRDDSEASITFELPLPIPDLVPAPQPVINLPVQPADTPSRAGHVTRTTHPPSPRRNREDSDQEGLESPPAPSVPLTCRSETVPTSPPSPATCTSPAQTEDLLMAKPSWPDPFEGKNDLPRSPQPPSDPRNGVGIPVHYHTEVDGDDVVKDLDSSGTSSAESADRPETDSVLWKKVKRSLLFWQIPTDVVRVSVFGPAVIAPGQPTKVSVYLHTSQATDSVRTLSRAFHHDSELIGSGYLAREVPRDVLLGVHLSVANAGVSKSLQTFTWRGQPQRLVFDLHVPWESPGGPAPGLVSIGRDNVRIGKIEFRLLLSPRKG